MIFYDFGGICIGEVLDCIRIDFFLMVREGFLYIFVVLIDGKL